MIYGNSKKQTYTDPRRTMKKASVSPENKRFFESVKRAMPAAARRARKIARMHGTPIYVLENGKIVAKKP